MNKNQFEHCVFCAVKLTDDKNLANTNTKEHIFGLDICKKLGVVNQNIKDDGPQITPMEYPEIFKYEKKSQVGAYHHYGVCRSCNGGWMNFELEKPVQKILDRIKAFKNIDFDEDLSLSEQDALVKWFVKIALLLFSYKNPDNHNPKVFKEFMDCVVKKDPVSIFFKNTNCLFFIDKANGYDDNNFCFFEASDIVPLLINELSGVKDDTWFSIYGTPKKMVVKIGQIIYCLAICSDKPKNGLWTDNHFLYAKEELSQIKTHKFVCSDPRGMVYYLGLIHQKSLMKYMVYFGGLIYVDCGGYQNYLDKMREMN